MKQLILISMSLVIGYAKAQTQNSSQSANASIHEMIWGTGMTRGNGIKAGEMAKIIPLAEGEVIGNEFMTDNWCFGEIVMQEAGARYNVHFRYNIRLNELLIKSQDKVFAISGQRVKTIQWISEDNTPVLLTNMQLLSSDKLEEGFLQLLDSGAFCLYKMQRIEVVKPNYNAALQTGSRDTEITKHVEFFYRSAAGPLIELKNKKSFSSLPEIQDFIKSKNLSIKNERDLRVLFAYLNKRQSQ